MARVLLFGAGATGARIARQLRSSGAVDTLEIRDPSLERRDRLVDDLGDGAVAGRGRRISDDPAVVIIATPPGTQLDVARRAIREGIAVVTTSNQTSEVRRLLELDDEARSRRIPVVVGAGFMPGLSCVL
ncbi:MAG: saccharopine dehydrogenase NADP-binding domain-containing protein, partial [Acidimicrobiales bacterium]|nr:saccharopine dehydrogenase NADP-binding domain-containing protein [Acidimicrobiales bacterium]